MLTRAQRQVRRHVFIYLALTPFVVFALFPVAWMAITAFKNEAELYRMDGIPFWFHLPPTLDNFRLLLFKSNYFLPSLLNSLLLTVYVVTITLLTAVPAGYALARLRLPGAENLGIAIFVTYLVPPIVLFLPLARVVGTLGLFDSWWALALVYPTFTIPFCTWMLMGFFKSLPRELEEAAWVDGCGLLGGILRVILPLSRPGIVIATIFPIAFSMNEVLYAVTYVGPREEKTVTVAIASTLIRGDIFYWGALMGAGLLVGLPLAVLYMFYLDHFIRGLTGVDPSA
ncbi:MAG TPA: carbohydrate ABC transporter permease [Methylomirabilota bacterium]|jgi:multiple sugar transport system permease protein|nr:carbohydrate ABC transporter permease [Methylomirabilota bacterium]